MWFLFMIVQAKEILNKAGAKCSSYMGELVKMAITDTTDNEDEYAEIADIYDVPVVSCSWVVMSHKCGKLLPTKPFPPKLTSTALFNGKVFSLSHISDKTDVDRLWAMITFNGGKTQRRLNDDVTHLICTDTTGKKYNSSMKYPNIAVVTPDWLLKCIQSKQIVDVKEYHPKSLVSNSSPALRRQLLSPVAPPPNPIDVMRKAVASVSPSKQKAKASPVTFQHPTTTSPSTAAGPPLPTVPAMPNAGYSNTTHTPRSKTSRPKLHEMPSGFEGFQHDANIQAAYGHMGQPMLGHMGQSMSPQMMRHPHRPQMPAQFPDPGYSPHGYGVPSGGQLQAPPGHHQVSEQ